MAVSVLLSQPTGQRISNVRKQQKKISILPILFLCYEESLVSSNLNSKLLWFHSVGPNVTSSAVGVRSFLKFHPNAFCEYVSFKGQLFSENIFQDYSLTKSNEMCFLNVHSTNVATDTNWKYIWLVLYREEEIVNVFRNEQVFIALLDYWVQQHMI